MRPLQFLNKLSKEEIKELINMSIASVNDQIADQEFHTRYVDYVSILNEFDRVDKNGNQYMLVTTMSQGNFIGSPYEISDFHMAALNYINSHLTKDFSNVLKVFMTKKFGIEYIQALHDLRVQEADEEFLKLSQYLGTTRQ